MKLQARFAFSAIALVVTVILGVGVMTMISEKKILESEIKTQHSEILRRLAQVASESFFQNELILFNYIQQLKKERAFLAAGFVDMEKQIKVHSNPAEIGKTLDLEKSSITNSPFSYSNPVAAGNTQIGYVFLVFNKKEISDFLASSLLSTARRFIPILFLSIVFGIGGAFFLAKMMTAPIQTLVKKMRLVGEGQMEIMTESNRKDELGWMTNELNKMIFKLNELDELKREFISSVTHELRSPLTAIERFVSLLIKGTYGPLSPDQMDSLMIVKNNTIRLGSFVDDLLTTSRIESKKIDTYIEKFDVKEVINEVLKLYGPLSNEKNLQLNKEYLSRETIIQSDKNKVIQILSNLVSNAIKFTEKGAVKIIVSGGQSNMQITVEDTGIGMSKEDKEKLFQKFYRAPLTSQKTKGTGLGLFIVKSYLDLLGGSIQVSDSHPHGSRFTFILPKEKLTTI